MKIEKTTMSDGLAIFRHGMMTAMKSPTECLTMFKLVCLVFLLSTYQSTVSAKEQDVKLEVIDPYIELHTGPGKGYPVFYTIEQGEAVTILTRRTGWYEVRAENGRVGWARASQIARTLLPTGEPVELPTVSYGDYLTNSWLVSFNVGQFTSGELEGADTFSFGAGFRPLSWLGLELEKGKFYDSEVEGDYYSFNLEFEPFSEWQVSPVLTVGTGRMEIESQPELTPLSFEKENFKRFGLGVNYYIGRNFVFHAGYESFNVSTDNDDERLNRWNLGFNAFF